MDRSLGYLRVPLSKKDFQTKYNIQNRRLKMCEVSVGDLVRFCNNLINKFCLVNPKYLQKDKLIFELVPAIGCVIVAHNSGEFSDFENMISGFSKKNHHSARFQLMCFNLKIYDEFLKGLRRDVSCFNRLHGMFDPIESIEYIYKFLKDHGMNVE